MSFTNGYKIFTQCISSAHSGLLSYSDGDTKKYIKNGGKFLYETFGKDIWYLMYHDLCYTIGKWIFQQKYSVLQNDIQKQVVILLPGFGSSTGSLPNVKEGITQAGYDYIPVDTRVLFHNIRKTQIHIIKQVLSIIETYGAENTVLFGYSYGGALAHLIGEKSGVPQVTYGTPLHPESSPFAVGAGYYGVSIGPGNNKTDNTIDIVEQYSFANPNPGDRVVAQGILSHFSPNRKQVVNLIVRAIQQSFDKI